MFKDRVYNKIIINYIKRSNPQLSDSAVVKVNGEVADKTRILRDGDSIDILDEVESIGTDPEKDNSILYQLVTKKSCDWDHPPPRSPP